MMKLLDLFSGIGGFSLGLEATEGFQTEAFVEINPFCRRILAKHWPNIKCYEDIHEVSVSPNTFDAFCGGFPCQDVSTASGKVAQSLLGDRSGLWFQYHRLISEGQPKWIIIENVEQLRNKGLSLILWQLAQLGYDAEWHVIPAYGVGLPQGRKRLWIIAYSNRNRLQRGRPFPLQGLRRYFWKKAPGCTENFLNGWDARIPSLLRSGHGIPDYMDRVKALGNSIIPEIAMIIGEAILEAEGIQI